MKLGLHRKLLITLLKIDSTFDFIFYVHFVCKKFTTPTVFLINQLFTLSSTLVENVRILIQRLTEFENHKLLAAISCITHQPSH